MAAGHRRAAWVGGVHVRVPWRSHHAWGCVSAVAARIAARFSAAIGADAEDPGHSVVVSRCVARAATLERTGLAARVAGGAAVYVSRWSGAGEVEDASE